MTGTAGPQWQPLSALTTMAQDVQEQFANSQGQYAQLRKARDRPHLLDDALIARVIRVVTDELELLAVYQDQLARWYQQGTTTSQLLELDRLTHAIDRWRELLQLEFALAHELGAGTIDKVLAHSDVELGAALLSGKMRFPDVKDAPLTLLAAARVQLATVIDLQMQPLLERRADDMTVLVAMQDAMAGFKQLMDTTEPKELQQLLDRFAGLHQFARVLERIAAGMRSGTIQVPT